MNYESNYQQETYSSKTQYSEKRWKTLANGQRVEIKPTDPEWNSAGPGPNDWNNNGSNNGRPSNRGSGNNNGPNGPYNGPTGMNNGNNGGGNNKWQSK